MEEYRTGTNQLISVHERGLCFDTSACVIHGPSDHHMIGWPTHWRDDMKKMERLCPHRVGHPDPDDCAFRDDPGIHGCDGCCVPGKIVKGSLVVEKEIK